MSRLINLITWISNFKQETKEPMGAPPTCMLHGRSIRGQNPDNGRTGGSGGQKRPFCHILSQLKPILMHSSALEPPCDARSDELDQKIPAVRRPSKKPLE